MGGEDCEVSTAVVRRASVLFVYFWFIVELVDLEMDVRRNNLKRQTRSCSRSSRAVQVQRIRAKQTRGSYPARGAPLGTTFFLDW